MDEGDSPRPSFLKRLWQHWFARHMISHPDDMEREIGSILEICQEKDLITDQERELIESIIEFKDTLVREIMVPRTEIIAVERTTPLEPNFRAGGGIRPFPLARLRGRPSTTSSACCWPRTS